MSYRQLSQEELSTIADLQVGHTSGARIAPMLERSRSTIYRELVRNKKPSDLRYRAEPTYSYARARRRRLRRSFHLPPSIALHGSFTVSHETIYQYILHDMKKASLLSQYIPKSLHLLLYPRCVTSR